MDDLVTSEVNELRQALNKLDSGTFKRIFGFGDVEEAVKRVLESARDQVCSLTSLSKTENMSLGNVIKNMSIDNLNSLAYKWNISVFVANYRLQIVVACEAFFRSVFMALLLPISIEGLQELCGVFGVDAGGVENKKSLADVLMQKWFRLSPLPNDVFSKVKKEDGPKECESPGSMSDSSGTASDSETENGKTETKSPRRRRRSEGRRLSTKAKYGYWDPETHKWVSPSVRRIKRGAYTGAELRDNFDMDTLREFCRIHKIQVGCRKKKSDMIVKITRYLNS